MRLLQGLGDACELNCIAKIKRLHFYLKYSTFILICLYIKISVSEKMRLSCYQLISPKTITIWKSLCHAENNVDTIECNAKKRL